MTTKQEIYEQILQLTAELSDTGVAEKIFSAAKEGDSLYVKEVVLTFIESNSDLYLRIIDFSEELKTLSAPDLGTFGEDRNQGLYRFSKRKVDALSLYLLILIGEIDEYYLFKSWCTESAHKFVSEIEKKGYQELARFVDDFSWKDWVPDQYSTWYELLVDIFKGNY